MLHRRDPQAAMTLEKLRYHRRLFLAVPALVFPWLRSGGVNAGPAQRSGAVGGR
jgi:hypothetical protein